MKKLIVSIICLVLVFGTFNTPVAAYQEIPSTLGYDNTMDNYIKNNGDVAEPLNSNETNFITTVKEGFEFAKQVNRSNFKTMVDFYHFSKMNETMDDLIFAKDMIAYVHIANYERGVPELNETPILKKWSKMLREINYDGRISIEAKYQDFDLEMLRFKDIFNVFKT